MLRMAAARGVGDRLEDLGNVNGGNPREDLIDHEDPEKDARESESEGRRP